MNNIEYMEPTKEEWDSADPNTEEYRKLQTRLMYSYYADNDRILSWFKPICDQFGYIPEPKNWITVIGQLEKMSPKDRLMWIIKEEKCLADLGWNPPRERRL